MSSWIIWIMIMGVLTIMLGYWSAKKIARQKEPLKPDQQERLNAAQEAAAQMETQQVNDLSSEADRIWRIVHQQAPSIDASVLNTAKEKVSRLCTHVECIRTDVERHCNDPAYLLHLRRTGFDNLKEVHELRIRINALAYSISKRGRFDHALWPLAKQVSTFGNEVQAAELVLYNRQSILSRYIKQQFGFGKIDWGDAGIVAKSRK